MSALRPADYPDETVAFGGVATIVACTIRREVSKVVVREDPSQGENSISSAPGEAGTP